MARDITSVYIADADGHCPIDSRIYYSDLSINQLPLMAKYEEYMKAGQYELARKYADDNGIDYFGSWVMNLFNNRLVAVQTYMKDVLVKPELVTYCKNIDDFNYSEPFTHFVGD